MRKSAPVRYIVTMIAVAIFFLTVTACNGVEERETASETAMNPVEKRLQDLEDLEKIRRLLMDYGRFLDRRDFESFSLLFAENEGEWIGGMGRARGQQAIRRLMEETIGKSAGEDSPGNFHLFTNDRIDLNGNRAAAETKWIFMVRSAGGKPEPFYLGHYEDELVREKGEWKFLRRVVFSDIPADNPESVRTE